MFLPNTFLSSATALVCSLTAQIIATSSVWAQLPNVLHVSLPPSLSPSLHASLGFSGSPAPGSQRMPSLPVARPWKGPGEELRATSCPTSHSGPSFLKLLLPQVPTQSRGVISCPLHALISRGAFSAILFHPHSCPCDGFPGPSVRVVAVEPDVQAAPTHTVPRARPNCASPVPRSLLLRVFR